MKLLRSIFAGLALGQIACGAASAASRYIEPRRASFTMTERTVSILAGIVLSVVVLGAVTATALRAEPRNVTASGPKKTADRAGPTYVVALGRIEPVSRVIRVAGPSASTSGASGRLWVISVQEGDLVRRGDKLATFDTEASLSAAVQQAEANLVSRRAQLAKTVADLDSQERTLAATLAQQEAERDRVQWDFDKMDRLRSSGLYNETALTDKRLALEAAQRRVETARLTHTRNRVRDGAGIRVDEATARADVASAEAALAKARADHDLAFLRSPVSGRVLRLIGRPGESVGSEGFAEIGDTSVMMVRTEVFEGDLRFVATGRRVEASSRSLDAPLSGEVERVGLRVGQQTLIREDPAAVLDARVVEVMVRLDPDSSRRVEALTNLQVRVAIPRSDADERGVPVANADPFRDADGERPR